MNVDSPVFFHHSDYIAYMEQQNWPEDPPVFQLKSMDLESSEAHEIPMNTSNIEGTAFHPATAAGCCARSERVWNALYDSARKRRSVYRPGRGKCLPPSAL